MIKPLSQASISQICTSVALQNLHSFIKELVENSIDAQSKHISITFFDFGKAGFEVSDDGLGIRYSEALKVAQKGGTSKLTEWSDLSEVDTLGFRGEALNAIAHLSKMKMSSRHADDELGWQKLYCDDQPPQYIAKEKGTTVHATDLFYTLPVRKLEFEKNYKAQYNKTLNQITEYAIIHPEIEFKVWNHEPPKMKSQTFNSGGISSFADRVLSVLGQSVYDTLIPIEVRPNANQSLIGYISKTIDSGSQNTSKKNIWYCFLNKRPINLPKQFLGLFTKIYRQYNPNGHFSFLLDIQYSILNQIDFNVSVDKRDVFMQDIDVLVKHLEEKINQVLEVEKFVGKTVETQQIKKQRKTQKEQEDQPQEVKQSISQRGSGIEHRGFISNLKKDSVQASKPQSQVNQQVINNTNVNRSVEMIQESSVKMIQERSISDLGDTPKKVILPQESQSVQSQEQAQELKLQATNFDQFGYQVEDDKVLFQGQSVPFYKDNFKDLVVLGQYNKGFLVCLFEQGRQILILDQHACDEKRNYETLIRKFNPQPTVLIQPFSIQLQGYEQEQAEEHRKKLESLGYRFRCQDRFVHLTALPSFSKQTIPPESFQEVLQNIGDEMQGAINLIPRAKMILATQACRSSIMVGQELSNGEMKQLCQSMAELGAPWNCPHGRPTFVRVSQNISAKLKQIAPVRRFSKLIYQDVPTEQQ